MCIPILYEKSEETTILHSFYTVHDNNNSEYLLFLTKLELLWKCKCVNNIAKFIILLIKYNFNIC